MSNEDWIRKIFSESELEELTLNYEKIVHDSEHGIVVNVGLSNDMCVDLVEAWIYSQRNSLSAQIHIMNFIDNFIEYLKSYLASEDIPFDNEE